MTTATVEGRTFDRVPVFDERSRQYPARTISGDTLVSRTWRTGPVLDQGREGACVGFSWTGELLALPKMVEGVDDAFAHNLYREAQRFDDFPGEDYEGSSVLGGAKAVKSAGYMPEYRWAFGVQDLALAVGHIGPAVIGINWYRSMFDMDEHGIAPVTGEVAGGHAILVRGIRLRPHFSPEPLFRLRNSWGPDWGIGGDCYVRWSDMDRLLKEDGECCVPVKRNRVAVPEQT